ncbi:polysaccharide biosynthesis/export family protein [Autumnicola musiva]|uniref:Polysaccharide biosynthesis/export family protein n=1 Tax=Autumnicola musiva TaxID=3075589 RepID=A0ABU3D845_9FLAO|nr:polysaccharide biosynthesis/export family protein [Zunongwangia sp. F117]MDT0677699.1 polysaccharide biosynthesis/export family protein [Zunongwangia sp. F117]
MSKSMFSAKISGITVLVVLMSMASCVSSRNATYFNLNKDSVYKSEIENIEPIIQKNDLLSISVSSLNPEASEMFNIPNLSATQTSTATGSTAQASGYLVDQDGIIRFPFLGKIEAAGKTKKALREEIESELEEQKLLVDPIVNIRYLNYKVSVLGEVNNPSVITIPDEEVTILEALGLAGDMTLYAKRDNVLLLREENDIKKIFTLDLTTDEIFNSQYYQLKSGDVIYVEANKSKIASTSRATQWLPVIVSTLSLAIIALDRLF